MIRNAARQTARLTYIAAGVLLIILALLTITARLGLPLLASQKSNIESRVSDYLESPVEIGSLVLRWEGFGPMLYASDVAVLETAERKVALDELLIDINLPKSLLRGIPIINELSLVGASLAIEADAAGQLRLHGMESISRQPDAADVVAPTQDSGGVDVLAWLFNARKVGLLDTRLTLIDLQTKQQLVLEDLNVRAESRGSTHQLRLDAQLPGLFGGRVEAGLDLDSKSGDLTLSDGSLYLSAESLNIHALTKLLHMSGLLEESKRRFLAFDATASVQLWGEWKEGQLVSARGPITLDQVVETRTGEVLFDNAKARLSLVRGDGSSQISIKDFNANLGAQSLQIEQLDASRTTTAANTMQSTAQLPATDQASISALQAAWQINALATELPADLMTRLARMAIVGDQSKLASMVQNLVADGYVRNLEMNTKSSQSGPLLDISAEFDAFMLAGDTGLPAIGPLDGEISITDSLGKLSFQAQEMPLAWSSLSESRLNVDSLDALFDIDVRDWQRVLVKADVQLKDEAIDTSTRVSATLIPGQSPHLDVQTRFQSDDISALKPWLPRKILGPLASDWFDQAIKAGKASDGTFLFFGNTADFPFKEGEGTFWASVDVSGGELEFLPDWPVMKNINANFELNGLSLTGVAEDSTLGQFKVSKTRASIANLIAPVLDIKTTAEGSFPDLIEFGINGPLRSILEPVVSDMSGTGMTQMDLELAVPLFSKPAGPDEPWLSSWRPFQVDGAVFLSRNDVTFGRAGLELISATGAVGFNEQGITINNLGGRVLGHTVNVTGKTVGEGEAADTSVSIKGVIEANDLLAHYGNTLDQFINGASQWTATITAPHSAQRIRDEGVALHVSSDLLGSELVLPVPFNKGSSTAVAFTLQTAFREDASEQIWDARFGSELSASVRLIDENLHSLLVELGEGRVADPSSLLEPPGIRLQGRVQRLAADGWVETISRYIDSLPVEQGTPQPILPISTLLEADALILGSRSLGKASLRSNTDDTYLNFTVSNRAVSGNMRYPRKHWLKDTALKARISQLDWSVIEALSGDEQDDAVGERTSELDPRILPPIEARVSLLTIDKIRLRDLMMRTQPNVSGLDITTLGFAYDTMRMVGQGHWYLRDPQGVNAAFVDKHTTSLNIVLQSDDFGTGFDEVGLSGILDDTQGSVAMKLNWPGPLYKPEIDRLDGSVDMNLQDGSIVPFEPGAGRMMGLFAIQALPRRLNLDFKDISGDGVAFKNIVGSALIDNGVAQVPLLQITGPIGVVDIEGTSDLNTQQFDQRVTVLPRVSAALPVIGAITGGASAGIGALVAAGFLKALGIDLDRIGLRTYRLTGAWAEPQFTPVPSDFWRQR